ncbi:hypothetical protein N7537_001841 [Penicillium hordei]|uniref:Uncharacterized protein n=1 Tax=Penicillium hordei TaxID=40994 RepID=A0AAD6H8F3_9EURO|nr:uncharacterized protein N7537_001841 [Penicillium hordei]KAJ5616727.1 hypothetical protein N7537_001841 [Penicillium hordei]
MAPPGIEPGLTQIRNNHNVSLKSKDVKKVMAPPGIEPGLTQIKTTTMCRHTTRPWHLLDIRVS